MTNNVAAIATRTKGMSTALRIVPTFEGERLSLPFFSSFFFSCFLPESLLFPSASSAEVLGFSALGAKVISSLAAGCLGAVADSCCLGGSGVAGAGVAGFGAAGAAGLGATGVAGFGAAGAAGAAGLGATGAAGFGAVGAAGVAGLGATGAAGFGAVGAAGVAGLGATDAAGFETAGETFKPGRRAGLPGLIGETGGGVAPLPGVLFKFNLIFGTAMVGTFFTSL